VLAETALLFFSALAFRFGKKINVLFSIGVFSTNFDGLHDFPHYAQRICV
jgi:hypothetical protein